MVKESITQLMPIFLWSTAIITCTLFVFIKFPGSSTFKFFLIPTALASTLVAPVAFQEQLGKSVMAELPEKSEFIAFKEVVVDGKKKYLEVWVKEKNTTRLYSVEWNHKLEQALKQAREGSKAGNNVTLGTSKKSGGGGGAEESNITVQSTSLASLFPKDTVDKDQ